MSRIRTNLDSREHAENIEACKEPRLVLPLGPETVSTAEQMGPAMGYTAWYSLTCVMYVSVKPAQNNARNKSLQIPGRILPPPATLFGVQNMPGADGLGHFATICAPPCADVAAVMSRTGTPLP